MGRNFSARIWIQAQGIAFRTRSTLMLQWNNVTTVGAIRVANKATFDDYIAYGFNLIQ